METCATIVPCDSVDYQARTRKCYIGSHHNNPLVIASSFDSAHSAVREAAVRMLARTTSRSQHLSQTRPVAMLGLSLQCFRMTLYTQDLTMQTLTRGHEAFPAIL
jgi:hypothetical protein